MSGRLARSCHEAGSTALDMLLLRYPGFVYGEQGNGATPVFCMHGIEPESFRAMLEFLDANGYATLDADQYHMVLTGRAPYNPRSVLLTFDDGWGSLWATGFPLIKRYGMQIVVFLPPGRIEHQDRRMPDLDDLHAGRCSAEEIMGRDTSDRPLLTWEEIVEMHRSGLVDFQSHSYNHGLICQGRAVVDLANPSMLRTANLLELPCYSTGSGPIGTRPRIRLGEPLYESVPRLSDVPRVIVDPSVADGCAEFVNAHGGEEFFTRGDWRDILERLARKLLKASAKPVVETQADQIAAIRHEVVESKRVIEAMLPGKIVRHMCYPWHVAGRIARRESMEAGYETNFLGRTGGKYYNPIPNDPYNIARLGGDFFFRLPGKGRVSLFSILMRKAARRVRHGSPYITH